MSVNIDLTPPVVTLTAPADGFVTSNSTVVVSAEVGDALSGLAVANCNGVAAAVVDGVVTCSATLRPGRNFITVSARDLAGHSSSAGAMVTLAGTPTRLTLSPAERTMLVNESETLALRDDFGMPAPGATWMSDKPWVVSLSSDDPPVLTALSSGTVTITATKNGLTSVATVTVIAGASLPDGMTEWTVAPTANGESLNWGEGPIYTNRVDRTGPDFFMVETNSSYERRLRAMSASGAELWTATSPGVPLMGDMFGGVIAGVEPRPNHCLGPLQHLHQRCYTALVRFAGPAGTAPWRYDSPGRVDRPAQGPDGTIYVIEHLGEHLDDHDNLDQPGFFAYSGSKTLVILDGATGVVTARVPLQGIPDHEPTTIGPLVGADGFGYVLTTTVAPTTLHRFSRDGEVGSAMIAPGICTDTYCRDARAFQLLPDGMGGLLVTANWANASSLTADLRLTRFDAEGNRTDTPLPYNTGRIDLIGQGGFAYFAQPYYTSVGQPVVELATLTTRWYLPIEWTLLAATPGGGAVAQNAAGDIAHFDGAGQLLRIIPSTGLRNPLQYAGGFVGNSNDGLRAVEGSFSDATYWDSLYREMLWSGKERSGFGGWQRNSAPRGFFSNYNAIDILTEQSATEIFNQYMRTFRALSENTVASVDVPNGSISGVGQVVTFQVLGSLIPSIEPFNFRVETIRFDPASHILSVKTLPGHPLFGFRYWKVTQTGIGKVRVETGGVDKPAAIPFNTVAYFLTHGQQTKLWRQYMYYILRRPGITWDLSGDAYRKQLELRGVWGYPQAYIMNHVCGPTPPLGVWICQ